MSKYQKVAISIPDETFRALERARKKRGQSRSEAVAAAVKDWVRGLDVDEASQRYIEGYLRIPEVVTAADEAIAAQSVAGWDPWEPGPPSRASEARRTPKRRRKPRKAR
ncbi:MAG TPA: ribbon-helix-helix domain-containing protein [Kofleriaceae bacterium]|jgi:metal-responsive CopG/Arc/MetJ family transcriptional regulator|nr:ribbon-helix-helix domain-containing protein [Kofleriaceae bacterium]